MAVMVWCLGCETVVWAYDHQEKMDLRGWLNNARMPCPRCKDNGNFDGFGFDNVTDAMAERANAWDEPGDAWGVMRAVAKYRRLKWQPSPYNKWFWRPAELEALLAKREEGR